MIIRDYKVRVFVLFAGFVFLFVIIIVRLFLIQIKQTGFFKKLAQFQYEQERTVYPLRGPIYDRDGNLLAFSKPVWSAFLVPSQMKQMSDTAKQFLQHEYPEAYNRLKKNTKKHFMWLERRLSNQRLAYIRERGFDDIHLIEEQERYYPCLAAAPVIGLADIDNKGIAGLELHYDQALAGLPMYMRLEKDARNKTFYFKRTIYEQGKPGKPLVTTLDSSLQNLVYLELEKTVRHFNAQSGAVLITNPDTGDVLAMVRYPSCDVNTKVLDDLDSLRNDTICECYEPGSVMKPFTALAALEEGVVDFDEPINCEAQVTKIDGIKVENPTISLNRILRENNYIIPFHEVVQYSSNVGIAKVAKRLEAKLYDHLMKLGFGGKTGIAFPGERDGFINHPKNWSKPSLIVMSFGYEMMVSLLQLARAYGVIANDGYLVEPKLVRPAHPECFFREYREKKVSKDQRSKLYSDQSILQIKDILQKIAGRFSIPGFKTMGKTGTAKCVKDGKYSDMHHHFTFAGIVEKGDYKRVIITFVKEPEETKEGKMLWASHVSAPLFKAVAEKMVIRDMTRGVVSSSQGL